MIVKCLEVGMYMANCYLVWCEETKEAVVIDPGGEGKRILAEIAKEQLHVLYIVDTHGHMDHIGANAEIHSATGAKLMIHEQDASMLNNSSMNLSAFTGEIQGSRPDILLHEGDEISCGKEVRLKVLHTPGHSPGGICLQGDGLIFTGDSLFAESIGRTDFPGGSYQDLIDSIKNKIMVLDDAYVVYPGHGPATTVGYERKHNPFL
jgi:glyoxylase-like metal-dependent hydrolase (beta-lactamase superfamily II)